MSHLARTCGFLVLAALPLVAAPVPKQKTDADRIVGVWHDGREGEAAYWHFDADGVAGTGAKKNPQNAKYRIDPLKDPKQFDWSHNGGKTWFLGVYELDGDNLKIALGRGGTGERPESVDGENRQFTYLKLKRMEK